MKKILALFFVAVLLTGCGENTDNESSPSVSSYTMIYPESEDKAPKDKIAVNDIYLLKKGRENIIVVDYFFKNCWFDNPASFEKTYIADMFIDGVQTEKYTGNIKDSDIDCSTKILSMKTVTLETGYVIKDISKATDFDLNITLYTGTLKVYEYEGKISDLHVIKE